MQIVDHLARRLDLRSLDYRRQTRTRLLGHAIDHVFYRGLRPLYSEARPVSSSDHNPIRVRFARERQPRTTSAEDAAAKQEIAAARNRGYSDSSAAWTSSTVMLSTDP